MSGNHFLAFIAIRCSHNELNIAQKLIVEYKRTSIPDSSFKSKDERLHLTDVLQKQAKSKVYWLSKIMGSFLDSA